MAEEMAIDSGCNCAFCDVVRGVAPGTVKEVKLAPGQKRIKMPTKSDFKSQKIRGLYELQELNRSLGRTSNVPFNAFTEIEQLDFYNTYIRRFDFPVFGRPAPTVPRHGFVDSRVCKTMDELNALFAEAKKEEAGAELIVARLIKASHNAIWASGQLTVGRDNDGATSGRDCLVFPTVPENPLLRGRRERKITSIQTNPYFEFVYTIQDKNMLQAFVTQMRDGPVLPNTPNYIPRTMRIEQVVRVDASNTDPRALLEWETKVKEFSRGTVVWHPGGSLASHYAVHCKLSEVPVIITYEPKVGGALHAEGTGKEKQVVRTRAFMEGVKIGLFQDNVHYHTSAITVVLAVLHNFVGYDMTNPVHAKLAGIGCGLAVRLGFLASLGEARHARSPKLALDSNRNRVYEKHWVDFIGAKKQIPKALTLFRDKKVWGGRSSFGGKAWAGCLEETINLWNCICDIHVKKATANDAVAILNKVINRAHNTGRFLNKFTGEDFFTEAASNPVGMAIYAAPWMYDLCKLEVAHVSKRFREEAEAASARFKATSDTDKYAKTKYKGMMMAAKHVLKGVTGFKSLFKNLEMEKVEEDLYEDRKHIKWVQANLRPGLALHFQIVFAEDEGYITHTIPAPKDVLAAMIWRAKDNQQLHRSLASSATQYVKFAIVRNRYFVIFNNYLNKWVTAFDCATLDSSVLLPEFEKDGMMWDTGLGKAVPKPKQA